MMDQNMMAAINARLGKAKNPSGNLPVGGFDFRSAPQTKTTMDPRGIMGILSRGAPVYNGGSMAARVGGGQGIGRPAQPGMPPMDAINRRLGM